MRDRGETFIEATAVIIGIALVAMVLEYCVVVAFTDAMDEEASIPRAAHVARTGQ